MPPDINDRIYNWKYEPDSKCIAFFAGVIWGQRGENWLSAQVLLLNGGMCGLLWGWALRGNSLENIPRWVILTETTPWGSMAAQALDQQHTGKSGSLVQGSRVMSKQKSCRCWSPVKKRTHDSWPVTQWLSLQHTRARMHTHISQFMQRIYVLWLLFKQIKTQLWQRNCGLLSLTATDKFTL